MGQSYCETCCTDKNFPANYPIINDHNNDEPKPSFAKCVKHYIDIHPKVKQIFLQHRDNHFPDRRGTKLSLYYLFQYAAYYQGQWKNGLPQGYGRLIYDDGSVYQGCFKQGTAECRDALFIKQDGSYYKGEVLKNKANGKGVFISDKMCYEGSWVDDHPHGQGRQIYSRNSYYQGHFLKGKKHGYGQYYWNSNEYYHGDFRNDELEGWGTHVTKQYEYIGPFKNGEKCGKGTMKNFIKKWEYTGDFDANKLDGRGVFVWNDGTKFSGQFQKNKKKKGQLILPDGTKINDFNQQ